MQPDELNSEAQCSTPRMGGDEEKAISTFEEAFRRIKEATGLTDVQVEQRKEVVVPAAYVRKQRCQIHLSGCFVWLNSVCVCVCVCRR